MTNNAIKMKARIKHIRYYKNEWGIIVIEPLQVIKGDYEPLMDEEMIAKGQMVDPIEGEEVFLTVTQVDDNKYGRQFEISTITSAVVFDDRNEEAKRKFLETVFTPTIVENLYDALEDPFKALNDRDYAALSSVYGCGMKNAVRWADRFESKIGLGKLYVELQDYDLTTKMLQKLYQYYGSSELVIKRVKEDPYSLLEISGIGFTTCDSIAMRAGMDQWDKRRIGGFIIAYLQNCGMEGRAFVTTDMLMAALEGQFGSDIPDLAIAETIHDPSIEEKLWWDDEKTKIGLRSYYKLEQSIADNMKRLLTATTNVHVYDWVDKVHDLEAEQGWQYTDQQMTAIQTAIEQTVVIIEGKAGTGKSSCAGAIINTLSDYSIALCALSGKAATRLAEVAGREGSTIHRLLGANGAGAFLYNEECKLPYDVIVVDEISMIDGWLFNSLLKAIKSGTKLIMLGDTGQLEPIGSCNIAFDLIHSGEVPVVTLNKIHRQAEKSAIITDSIAIRNGRQIVDKDWAGTSVRGENRDLILDFYLDKSNTFYRTMGHFKQELDAHNNDITKVQVLCPIKSKGDASTWTLNRAIQDYYNPANGQEEITVHYTGRGNGILREGDKVINVQNNYKTFNVDGDLTPIYNGNLGTITMIDSDYIIVDFTQVGRILVPMKVVNTLELGYATTVHKFQGAQAEVVIFALDWGSYSLLTRELLYTGITRAQKKCIVCAQTAAFRYAVMQEGVSNKMTHLKNMMVQAMHPTGGKVVF